jgi:hypothetical protein
MRTRRNVKVDREPIHRGGCTIMGIGVSVFLLAVGAILAFAVDLTVSGLDLDTVGIILMIVGAIGLLISTLFLSSFSPYGGRRSDRDTVVREERF